jgi:hypothetical protein
MRTFVYGQQVRSREEGGREEGEGGRREEGKAK